jgi:uncharacterized protein YaaQ
MTKKMVLAILEDLDSNNVMEELGRQGFPSTLIDTTGGLLSRGNSTLIAAVDEQAVDDAIDIIQGECDHSPNPFQKRATIMVLGVDHFEQIS